MKTKRPSPLPKPTKEEAQKAGICEGCPSYKPDHPFPSGGTCWSMTREAIGLFCYCTRTGAAEMIAEKEAIKKGAPKGPQVT